MLMYVIIKLFQYNDIFIQKKIMEEYNVKLIFENIYRQYFFEVIDHLYKKKPLKKIVNNKIKRRRKIETIFFKKILQRYNSNVLGVESDYISIGKTYAMNNSIARIELPLLLKSQFNLCVSKNFNLNLPFWKFLDILSHHLNMDKNKNLLSW